MHRIVPQHCASFEKRYQMPDMNCQNFGNFNHPIYYIQTIKQTKSNAYETQIFVFICLGYRYFIFRL